MTTTTSTRTTTRWPLERILFAMAATMTLLSPWFLLLTAFVGINQWLYVLLRGCPASLVLRRLGAEPQCRW
jgi:hypothetical protein